MNTECQLEIGRNKSGCPYIGFIRDTWYKFKLDINEGGKWFVFNIWYTESKTFFMYIAIWIPFFKEWFRWSIHIILLFLVPKQKRRTK